MINFLHNFFLDGFSLFISFLNLFMEIDYCFFLTKINNFWEYIKDSKDVLLWFLWVIFAIYIPFLLYFYQEVAQKKQYKMLDLYLFQNKIFNLKQIIWSLVFLVIILLFWNKQDASNFFVINTIIIVLSIPVWIFLIKNLFNLYNLNLELKNENNSWKLDNLRIEWLKKLELNNKNFYIWNDTMQDINFQDYKFAQQFFKILFEKIISKVKFIYSSTSDGFQRHSKASIIRDMLEKYKTLDIFPHIFYFQDLKYLLELYKMDYDNNEFDIDFRNEILEIIRIKIEKHLTLSNVIIRAIDTFLITHKDNQKFISYFVWDLQSEFFESQIILNNRRAMKYFWKQIFNKYKNFDNATLFFELFQKLLLIIQSEEKYNSWYDMILHYWLLDFEPITFARLCYLFFTSYGENRALDILEKKKAFWLIWRTKSFLEWEEEKIENKYQEVLYKTIQNFKKYFAINKEELTQLKEQFQALIDEKTIDGNKVNYAKNYIYLIEKLTDNL